MDEKDEALKTLSLKNNFVTINYWKMKFKILLPVFTVIVALAIAVTGSAFKGQEPVGTPAQDEYYFEFNQSLTPSETNVELYSNWAQVTDEGTCNQTLTRPCRIKVPASATDDNGPGNPRTLKSTASIIALPSTGGMHYVDVAGDVTDAYNRSN